jgi:hypothetical protein
MNQNLETQARFFEGKPPGGSSVRRDVRREVACCLVVSGDASRRSAICDAAQDAGWESVVCEDGEQAAQAARRTRFQMAWVDMEEHGTTEPLRDLCQSIAALPGVLLVICGHAHDPQEEIWARELGVWLYLPGVSLVPGIELQMLCEQAMLIAGGPRAAL